MSNSKAVASPEDWADILRESDADLAAGVVVPLATIRAELRSTIEEIEAEIISQPVRPAAEH